VKRKLLGLSRPLFTGVSPHFCRYIDPAAVIPLGKTQRQAFCVGIICISAVDIAILIARAKLYFQEDAYRHEKLYNAEKPVIDRVGLQGDAMTVAVCTDNEKIDQDIQLFSQALSNDDELLGERLSTLSRILKEMGY
jgi:hypothetical protein